METLVMTEDEVKKAIQDIGIESIFDSVERAFGSLAEGDAEMPPKSYVSADSGDFRAMPGRIGQDVGVKWVNSHPENPEKYGLPSVMGLIIYSDIRTGYPLAIMDGTLITQYRTGAAGGIASKYLANPGSESLGMVGCGTQAITQFLFINHVMKLRRVKLYDIRRENALRLRSIVLAENPECKVEITDVKEACSADIVVTTTPSRSPVVRNEWIKAGTHINAIGADAEGKQELDPEILKRARIVVDEITQASHSGEINVPLKRGLISEEDIYGELGEIITGRKRGRESEDEITVFDSTGLAIQDIAVAGEIYRFAINNNLGRMIKFV